MVGTIGELASELSGYAFTKERASRIRAKISGPPVAGTRDSHYTSKLMELGRDASRIWQGIVDSPGYSRVAAVCEAEYGVVTAERLKRMRGRLAVATGHDIRTINAMSFEGFAEQYLQHARSSDSVKPASPKERPPRLHVTRWSELGIGIDEHRAYRAIKPVPAPGGRISIADTVEIELRGKQWPALLELLADSSGGCSTPRSAVIKEFGYVSPLSNLPSDPRARPGAISEGIVTEEVPSQASAALKSLNTALSSLAKSLRGQVNGPTGKHVAALYVDGEFVRSRFVVRYLIRDESGHYSFGHDA